MSRSSWIKYAVVFIVAVLIKWTILYYYEVVSSDKLLQATAAVSIAEGKGYTIPIVSLNNPDSVVQRSIIEWPPLYSILLAPLLKLTGFNMEKSCLILDLIAGLLLLLFFLLLMQKLQFPPPLIILLLLHRAFDMNKDVLATYASDAFATAMWMGSFYFLLQYLDSRKRGTLFILAITNVCTFLFRYIYLPISLIIPVLLIWNGIVKKSKEELKTGVVIAVIALAGICLLGTRNYLAAGIPFFTIDADAGLFLESLNNAAPIFWLPFLNIEFFTMQVSLRTSLSYSRVYILLQLSSTLALLILFVNYIRVWMRWRLIAPQQTTNNFTYYAGAVSVGIVFLLFFLSIFTRPGLAHLRDTNWSYLMEARYFQVPGIFIFLEVFRWAFKKSQQGIVRSIFRIVLISLCILQISHGAWVLIKHADDEKRDYSPYVASKERIANHLRVISTEEKSGKRELIVLTDKYGFIGESILQKIKVSNPVSQLEQNSFAELKNTMLMLIIDERSVNYYRPLIEKHRFQLDTILEGNSIFKKYY